jgi:hypothetical protein
LVYLPAAHSGQINERSAGGGDGVAAQLGVGDFVSGQFPDDIGLSIFPVFNAIHRVLISGRFMGDSFSMATLPATTRPPTIGSPTHGEPCTDHSEKNTVLSGIGREAAAKRMGSIRDRQIKTP